MGFRTAHANEALDYSIDKAAALDWLCMFGKKNQCEHELIEIFV
jgi:hypothetical protein